MPSLSVTGRRREERLGSTRHRQRLVSTRLDALGRVGADKKIREGPGEMRRSLGQRLGQEFSRRIQAYKHESSKLDGSIGRLVGEEWFSCTLAGRDVWFRDDRLRNACDLTGVGRGNHWSLCQTPRQPRPASARRRITRIVRIPPPMAQLGRFQMPPRNQISDTKEGSDD